MTEKLATLPTNCPVLRDAFETISAIAVEAVWLPNQAKAITLAQAQTALRDLHHRLPRLQDLRVFEAAVTAYVSTLRSSMQDGDTPLCDTTRARLAQATELLELVRNQTRTVVDPADPWRGMYHPSRLGDVLMVSDRAITDEEGSGEVYAAPPAHQPANVDLEGLDRALGKTIEQRDRYHEVADDLAARIAAITGVDIGEHSSANCPWQNAIKAAEEYKPAQAVDLAPAPAAIPDTPEVRDILGRPNFWCSPWANILRRRGDVIPCKAEEEQAAVIRFMLNHYLARGEGWTEAAEAELQAIRYQVARNG